MCCFVAVVVADVEVVEVGEEVGFEPLVNFCQLFFFGFNPVSHQNKHFPLCHKVAFHAVVIVAKGFEGYLTFENL